MLAHLCDMALAQGLSKIKGRMVPTDKNVPVRDLFDKHGFSKLAEEDAGTTIWELNLAHNPVQRPPWFKTA
jgi:predicted enzyme involved in methoxymalonyl-ACP biosynthesis